MPGEAADGFAQGAARAGAEEAVDEEGVGARLGGLPVEEFSGDAGELGTGVGAELVGRAGAQEGDGEAQGGGEADGVSGVVAFAGGDDDVFGVKVGEFAATGSEEFDEAGDDAVHELQGADAALGKELLLGGADGGA